MRRSGTVRSTVDDEMRWRKKRGNLRLPSRTPWWKRLKLWVRREMLGRWRSYNKLKWSNQWRQTLLQRKRSRNQGHCELRQLDLWLRNSQPNQLLSRLNPRRERSLSLLELLSLHRRRLLRRRYRSHLWALMRERRQEFRREWNPEHWRKLHLENYLPRECLPRSTRLQNSISRLFPLPEWCHLSQMIICVCWVIAI